MFLTSLAILLIALKLTGFIGISWWVVLAPLWVPWALIIFLVTLTTIIQVITNGKS